MLKKRLSTIFKSENSWTKPSQDRPKSFSRSGAAVVDFQIKKKPANSDSSSLISEENIDEICKRRSVDSPVISAEPIQQRFLDPLVEEIEQVTLVRSPSPSPSSVSIQPVSSSASTYLPPPYTSEKIPEKYTWSLINERVSKGELLVVAKGMVYKLPNEFVENHPGGSNIIYGLTGTDISRDFYPIEFPQLESASNFEEVSVYPAPVRSYAEFIDKYRIADIISRGKLVNDDEMRLVRRSIRNNDHPDTAVQVFESFVVGSIVESPNDCIQQFKRYALVKKLEQKNQVLLKFVSLYDNTTPSIEFEPGLFCTHLQGQKLEFQCHFSGQPQETLFYPVSGNANAFEILVFPTKDNIHSYLALQRPGTKQYKFRGPLGKPLRCQQQELCLISEPFISPPFYHGKQIFDLLQGEAESFRNLVYIGTETSIDPFVQILKRVFLRTNEVVYSHSSFVPRGSLDEMIVQDGDGLVVHEYFDDGWCFAYNTRTGVNALCPATLLIPSCGVNTVVQSSFHLITVSEQENAVAAQIDIVNACFPGYLKCEIISQLNEEWLEKLGSICLPADSIEPAICIGLPLKLSQMVYQHLVDEIGVDPRKVVIIKQ